VDAQERIMDGDDDARQSYDLWMRLTSARALTAVWIAVIALAVAVALTK
jgi:hypothetical protein